LDANTIIQTLKDGRDTAHVTAQIDWAQFGALISAIGALGVAAYGVVEALGKALTFSYTEHEKPSDPPGAVTPRATVRGSRMRTIRWGLPYVGFGAVSRMAKPLAPALECSYGANYLEIIAQQYRADRGTGRAPDMIREGVKLGLPFLTVPEAEAVISHVWKMEPARALALAQALNTDTAPPAPGAPALPPETVAAQLLAGRFATALNERVTAAFLLAEEQYEAWAKMLAGAAAVGLAVVFNLSLNPRFPWWVAAIIGVVAVPLAPVAKDLSTSLQNALTAFKSIPTKRA
jgi:hypothetical protein